MADELRDRLSKEKLEELGRELDLDIDAGLTQRGALKDRWDKNERLYRNQQPGTTNFPFPNAANIHVPLMQPKIDTLVANTCSPILSNQPYFIGRYHGDGQEDAGKIVEENERVTHYFFEIAGFDKRCRELARGAAINGLYIAKIDYHEQAIDFLSDRQDVPMVQLADRAYSGLNIQPIHPANFVIYPAVPEGIAAAKLTGHRFFRRLAEIKELGEAGRYLRTHANEINGGDDADMPEAGRDSTFDRTGRHQPPQQSDATVELWECIYKLKLEEDKTERWYKVVIAKRQKVILDIEPYILPRPWYFDLRYHTEPGKFWPSTSVAQNLQALQIEYNNLNNIVINGSYMASAPPILGGLTLMGPQKSMKYAPGDWLPTDSPIPPTVMQSQFNPGVLIPLIQHLEQRADEAVRISNPASGAPLPGRRTATEAQHIQQGLVTGLNEYLQNFGIGLTEMASFSNILLAMNAGEGEDDEVGWLRIHGAAVGMSNPEQLLAPIRYELNGKTPSNTPTGRLNAAFAFVDLIGNNPFMAPVVQWPAVARAVAKETELPNSEQFVKSDDQIQQEQQAQLKAEANGTVAGNGAANPGGGVAGPMGGQQMGGVGGVLSAPGETVSGPIDEG